MLLTKAMDWPSLTCQWLPDEVVSSHSSEFNTYSLLLGTHTCKTEQEYIKISGVDLPTNQFTQSGSGAATPASSTDTSKIKKVETLQKIAHEGEVNRARYCPLNPSFIASTAVSGDVLIFDRSALTEDHQQTCTPLHRLKHHTKECWGLAWSHEDTQKLLSSSEDSTVALWDISHSSSPIQVLRKHSASVNEVQWSKTMPKVFGSVSDDLSLQIYDTRIDDSSTSSVTPASIVMTYENAHPTSINTLSFNPFNEYILATGSSDTSVNIWDLRCLRKPVYGLHGHSADVSALEWSPHDESVLLSAGYDRRVNVWDLSLTEQDQTEDEQAEGPPELLFVHGGHTNKVIDVSWHPTIPWMVSSVSEDNIVQVWKIAGSLADKDLEAEDDERHSPNGTTNKERGESDSEGHKDNDNNNINNNDDSKKSVDGDSDMNKADEEDGEKKKTDEEGTATAGSHDENNSNNNDTTGDPNDGNKMDESAE